MRMDRYIYVVVGISYGTEFGDEGHIIISNSHAAHTSLKKAQEELNAILAEIREESFEENYTFTHQLNENDLSVTYESGLEEYYKINKLKLN